MKNLKKIFSLILGVYVATLCFLAPLPYKDPLIAHAASSSINKTYFDDIILNQELPSVFYKNEIYIIKGSVSQLNDGYITVILENSNNKTKKTFSEKLSESTFEIPVYFKETGTYSLGIINGENGKSKASKISVADAPTIKNSKDPAPVRPQNLSIVFRDGKTLIRFPSLESSLKEISLSQDDKIVKYISRQNEKSIPINYSDFDSFKEKPTTASLKIATIAQENPLLITSEFSSSVYKRFTAINHQFAEISEDQISIALPDKLSYPLKLSLSGTAKEQLDPTAYTIKPDGFVDKITLSNISKKTISSGKELVDKNSRFTFSYTPTKNETYIIEINNKDSIPVVNYPIYIGNGIPLVPDFFDLNSRTFFKNSLNIKTSRTELLAYINESRKEHGLSPVTLSEDLSKIAQSHSEDMVKNNFFSHINKSGESPNDRRLKAGIFTPVSENIAKDTSVKFAHMGLMRSASHRMNILGKGWTQVGLGITEKDGYLFITEEFSGSEFSQKELDKKETEFLQAVNNKRKEKDLNELIETASLKSAANYINSTLIKAGSSINDFSQEMLSAAMSKYNISGSVTAIGRNYHLWEEIASSILNENNSSIIKNLTKDIGIDIQLDKKGNIQIITLFRSL